jgi:hypothetical protein
MLMICFLQIAEAICAFCKLHKQFAPSANRRSFSSVGSIGIGGHWAHLAIPTLLKKTKKLTQAHFT